MFAQVLTSFFASMGFSILFNTPKRLLIACGLCGVVGWMSYVAAMHYMDSVPASLIATFCVSILSQILARTYKVPIVTFNASGVIALVPGGMAYDAMLYFVHNDYTNAIPVATRVFLISGAIAGGLLFSEVVYRVTRKL